MIMNANNARQTDAALPTIADMSSPQTYEAGATRQPAGSAPHAFSSGQSTAIESMSTDTGDLRHRVTTRPVPSHFPAASAVIDEQGRQWRETWIEGLRRDELERTSYTPRGVRETRHIILNATNARQTDAGLTTTADISSPQTHEAGATRQPAESDSHAFSSGHSTTNEPMGTNTGNPRRRATSQGGCKGHFLPLSQRI